MNAEAEIIVLLAQWRSLTELEGQAIERNDWRGLAEQQRLKAKLQQEMTRAWGRLGASDRSDAEGLDEHTRGLEGIAAQVLGLEACNRNRLRAKRLERQAKLDCLHTTIRRLEDLRRAYGSRGTQHWQSYS
ncbi:hypothetical protein SBV1_810015 [Verrucomicrobia bacterium]|nr:hypothetical protein SBV1_810015 [Verrucomicrobiota bacterium]